MDQSSFELRDRSNSVHSVSFQQQVAGLRQRTNSVSTRPQQEQQQDLPGFSLPPADGGKDAWLLLAGAFVIEGLIWGYAFSYGIFQEYYSGLELFTGQENQIPVIGTTATGIMYLCSPLALPLLRSYPHRKRQGMLVGLLLLTLAHVASSFARNAWQLIITQGVLVGIGSSIIYYPIFMLIDEWFVRRKGFAYGIAWAASGLSGLGLPYCFSWLLEKYSFRTTLRIWAAVNVLLIAPALFFLKPRLPHSVVTRTRLPSLTFTKNLRFLVFCFGSLIVAFGYFLPGIYLPSYALSIGLTHTVATTSISILNAGAFVGFVCGGILTDYWSSNGVLFCSTVGTTLSILLLWGFSSNAPLLLIFALLYSFFGSCFVTTWPGTIKNIVAEDPSRTTEPSTVYAFFIAGRGIGNVVSGPLSQVLLQAPRLTNGFQYGYGSSYSALIIFAAISAALGGVAPTLDAVKIL